MLNKPWKVVLGLLGIVNGAEAPANSQATEHPTKRVELNTLVPGPIQHAALPEDLIKRADAILVSLNGLLVTPRDEWLEGFRRDKNPEKEIAIWEAIVDAFELFNERNQSLTAEQRGEALGLLLMRSGDATEGVFENTPIKHLSRPQAELLLSLYSDDPKPITIMER